MGDIKRCYRYKAGDKYCLLCMEEKLTIAFYDNTNELLNQRLGVSSWCNG